MRRCRIAGLTRRPHGVVLLAFLIVLALVGLGAMAAFDVWSVQRQREREAQWAQRRQERGRWDAKTETVQRLIEVSDLLVRAALVAAGFRQHQRGEWRRQHGRSA